MKKKEKYGATIIEEEPNKKEINNFGNCIYCGLKNCEHLKQEPNKKEYWNTKCSLCGEYFKGETGLSIHKSTQHNKKPKECKHTKLECLECGKIIEQDMNFNQ